MKLLQALGLSTPATLAKPSGPASTDPKSAALKNAAAHWRDSHKAVGTKLNGLKAAVQKHYSNDHPELIKDIQANMSKIDALLSDLDHTLADALETAASTPIGPARDSALFNVKRVIGDNIAYVNSNPLVAHIDSNPFHKTDLKATIAASLRQAVQALAK